MDTKLERIVEKFRKEWEPYPIVRCMFTRNELIELLRRSGLTPRGMRISKFQTHELALTFANLMKDMSDKELKHIIKGFLKKHGDKLEKLSTFSISQMRGYLNSLDTDDVNPKDLVVALFATVLDERKGFNALRKRAYLLVDNKAFDLDFPGDEAIMKNLLALRDSAKHGVSSVGSKKLAEELNKYRKELEDEKRKREEIAREIKKLQSRLDAIHSQIEKLKAENKELRRREAELINRNKELERENAKLREEIKKLKEYRPPSETELTMRLEKSIRKLRESMEYYVDKLGLIEERHSQSAQRILDELTKIKSHLFEDRDDISQKFEKIETDVRTLSKNVEYLRNYVMKLSQSASVKEQKEHREAPGNRIGVFVDVQNIYYAAKDMGGKPDYRKLKDFILGGRRVVGLYAYVVINPAAPDQERFLHFLENEGFTVKTRFVKKFFDGNMKGNWDLGMAVDMIENANKMDIIALVTGDGDFAPVVRMLQRMGKRVEVYSFENTISSELKEAADMCKLLDTSFVIPE